MRVFFTSAALLLFAFSGVVRVQAATLYMDPRESEVFPGDTISVALRLDTDEGECINVIDGVITYESNIVPVDISRGSSIVPLWVEEPTIDTEHRTITFAGGIPNGYCGRIAGDPRLTNIIAEIIFQVPGFSVNIGDAEDGIASIDWAENTTVYRNDNTGEQAPLTRIGATFAVGEKPRGEVFDEWNPRVRGDTIPPHAFNVSVSTDASIFNGKHFITFNTTDKESGLDHYEIMEESIESLDLFGWGAVGAPWKEGRSPYVLEDQSLNSIIRVKAVDKAGNEYVAVYLPPEETRGISDKDYIRTSLAVAGTLIIVITVLLVIRHRIKLWRAKRSVTG